MGIQGLRAPFVALAIAALTGATTSMASADSLDGRWANDTIVREITTTTVTPRRTARATRSTWRTTRTASRQSGRRGRQVYTTLATYEDRPSIRRRGPVTGGGGVRWIANAGCLAGSLRSVVTNLASSYGPLTVNSTCRSRAHNRRVGGATRSYHLTGQAVDFRIHQNVGAAYASLRASGAVGGLKHYGGGLFHIDTGPRRTWR